MSCFAGVTITYQAVVDENGKPTAAQIPWEQFELIQRKLDEEGDDVVVSAEWSDASAPPPSLLERADGNLKAPILFSCWILAPIC